MKKLYFLSIISLFLEIPCTARVIIVDANGTGDYPTIQAAIDDSNDGDIVEVQQGTYTGIGNHNIDFLGKAITVRSTNPQDPCLVASTVIDCQGAGRGFYFHSGEDANSILDGLKITNGYVTISSPGGSAGGGICCTNQSEPTIANCDISGNTAIGSSSLPGGPPPSSGNGGGVYGCNGTIINCNIRGNTTAGDFMTFGCGGGLYECNGTIINCTISGNTALGGGGGGGLYRCNGTLANCIISNNTAYGRMEFGGRGGGLYICNRTITNCTISGNTASGVGGPTGDGLGGGLYDCGGTMTNCIIWGNLADISPELYNSSEPNYSCIKDWIGGGIGNIVYDPCFADPCNGDYHLKSQAGHWDANSESWMIDDVTSPCIDTGNPVSPIGLELFPNGGLVNMGAYGRTSEASKSYFGKPPCEIIIAGDVNGDCIVNFLDFRLMALHWCEDNNP